MVAFPVRMHHRRDVCDRCIFRNDNEIIRQFLDVSLCPDWLIIFRNRANVPVLEITLIYRLALVYVFTHSRSPLFLSLVLLLPAPAFLSRELPETTFSACAFLAALNPAHGFGDFCVYAYECTNHFCSPPLLSRLPHDLRTMISRCSQQGTLRP